MFLLTINMISVRSIFRFNHCHSLFMLRTFKTYNVNMKNQLNVFDRKAKNFQRDRAISDENYEVYEYIKEEIGFRLSDRILDVRKKFDQVVDIGSGTGYVARHITDHSVTNLTCTEMSEKMLSKLKPPEGNVTLKKLLLDEDGNKLPFESESVDLCLSCMSIHWVNDLPNLMNEVLRILKKDGVFLGAMFGGQTLFELRGALQLGETEREGGFAPHISPFVEVQDLATLLNRAGFTMLTIDTEELRISYPTIFELMFDLKGMAENNSAWSRKAHFHRDSLLAANAIYKELYGNEDGSIPATYQIYYWIGWKPHPNQPKPLTPHQAPDVSLADLYKLDSIIKEKNISEIDPKTPKTEDKN